MKTSIWWGVHPRERFAQSEARNSCMHHAIMPKCQIQSTTTTQTLHIRSGKHSTYAQARRSPLHDALEGGGDAPDYVRLGVFRALLASSFCGSTPGRLPAQCSDIPSLSHSQRRSYAPGQ